MNISQHNKGTLANAISRSIPGLFIPLCLLISGILFTKTVLALPASGLMVLLPPDSLLKDTVIQLQKGPGGLDREVRYEATDSMSMDAEKKQVHLYGQAKVDYEGMNLTADYIYIDFGRNVIHAMSYKDSLGRERSNVHFKEGSQEFRINKMSYNFKTKKGQLSGLVTKEGEGIIYGDKVKKDEFNNSYVRGARYTTCDAEHPHFFINASKLKIIPDKQVVTGPAYLVVEDVPTPGFIPFGFFPISKRQKSGVLIPTYGNSPDRGFFLRNGGYYFAFNDYIHSELRGDIYTNSSWALYGIARYKARYRFDGNFDVRYSRLKQGEPETPSATTLRDFFITWNHRVDPKARPNTQFSAKVNAGSARYLSLNTYNANTIVTNQLNSSISYGKVFGKLNQYSLTANLNHSQSLLTNDITLGLPEVFFGVQRFFPFKKKQQLGTPKWYEDIGVQYNANFRNEIRTKDSLLFDRASLDSTMRMGMTHNIPISTSFKVLKYFTLSPGIGYQEYWYLRSIERYWDSSDSTLKKIEKNGFKRAATYNASISLTTRIYGQFNFRSNKIKAIRHVLTPTLSWVYQPDFSAQRFGYYKKVQSDINGNTLTYSIFENGIYGGPGAGRQGQLSYSLINNLEMKVMKGKDTARHEEKVKIFETFNISGNYNFFADSLKLSHIQVNTRTTLFKNLQINVNAVYDPYAFNAQPVVKVGDVTRYNSYNVLEWDKNRRLARLTSASIALSTSLNPSMLKKEKNPKEQKLKDLNMNSADYIDFDIPWNLTLNYNLSYIKPYKEKTVTQSLNFNGDLSLTKSWKIGFTSGYDFVNKDLTFTTIDFHRDLHCWQFSLQWIPFGFRQSYFFNINVKSNVLSELKLSRRRDWFDQL